MGDGDAMNSPATFTDNAERAWVVEINTTTIKRVRALTGLDLLETSENGSSLPMIEKLIADPILLVDAVYAVCKPQADEAGITDEQFGEAMAGDVIEDATRILLEQIVAFFPSPRDRANMQRILRATWGVMDKARDRIEARLTDEALEQASEAAIAATFGETLTSSPDASASTQDRSHSPN